MLKKVALVAIATLLLSMVAFAQDSQLAVYSVNYFDHNDPSNAMDQTEHIINTGLLGAPQGLNGQVMTSGYLCANIYVFDKNQEMLEACACPISPDSVLVESVRKNLTANPVTGIIPALGVIKVTSSIPISVTPNGVSPVSATAVCDAGDVLAGIGTAANQLAPGLKAWGTHTQVVPGGNAITEGESQEAQLGAAEARYLPIAANWAKTFGSGQGLCSCGDPQ